jgi:hypothetical protein
MTFSWLEMSSICPSVVASQVGMERWEWVSAFSSSSQKLLHCLSVRLVDQQRSYSLVWGSSSISRQGQLLPGTLRHQFCVTDKAKDQSIPNQIRCLFQRSFRLFKALFNVLLTVFDLPTFLEIMTKRALITKRCILNNDWLHKGLTLTSTQRLAPICSVNLRQTFLSQSNSTTPRTVNCMQPEI